MKKKTNELSSLSIDELKNKSKEFNDQLFKLKLQLATGQLANTATLKIVRKDLARVNTYITQKSAK